MTEPTTTLPGIRAKHLRITPKCRANRGAEEAFDEAVRQIREEYGHCVNDRTTDTTFHLAMTAEHPPGDEPSFRDPEAEAVKARQGASLAGRS